MDGSASKKLTYKNDYMFSLKVSLKSGFQEAMRLSKRDFLNAKFYGKF